MPRAPRTTRSTSSRSPSSSRRYAVSRSRVFPGAGGGTNVAFMSALGWVSSICALGVIACGETPVRPAFTGGETAYWLAYDVTVPEGFPVSIVENFEGAARMHGCQTTRIETSDKTVVVGTYVK